MGTKEKARLFREIVKTLQVIADDLCAVCEGPTPRSRGRMIVMERPARDVREFVDRRRRLQLVG